MLVCRLSRPTTDQRERAEVDTQARLGFLRLMFVQSDVVELKSGPRFIYLVRSFVKKEGPDQHTENTVTLRSG